MQMEFSIICPECRVETKVPAGGVKDLPDNFFINRLVDDLILKKKVGGEQVVKCDECDEDDPVVSFCPECNSFLCGACNDHHKRNKRYRVHAVVLFTELKSAPIQTKVKIPLCKEHDEQLKYYCETCDELVCMYCTVKKHSDHNHDSVKQMASKHRDELKKITDPIEGMIENLSEVHDNMEKMKKKIREQGEEINKVIDIHYDELLQKLMKQKGEVKQRACVVVLEKEKAVTTQLEEIALMQAELIKVKDLNDALEKGSDQETLSAKKQVIERVQQLSIAYKKVYTTPLESAALDFVPTKEPFPVFGHLFAYANPHTSEVISMPQCVFVGTMVEFVIVTKDSDGDRCVKGGSQVSVQLESLTGDVTAGKVRDNNNGSYMGSFMAEQVGEAKLLVYVNGEQIKGSPYSLVVNRNYQAIDKPSKIVAISGSPEAVAFSRNGLWAVADHTNHCMCIFDGKDQLVKKFGSYGASEAQFVNPIGVAFDSHNHLYVADCGNHRVQKFDASGNFLLQFGSKGASAGELSNPSDVTVFNDKVYIADFGNKRISVFQTNGKFYMSFGSDRLNRPSDVAVGADNHLLVDDYYDNCIYSFTLGGDYIGKFGSSGSGRGQLYHPHCLTTDLEGFILVADTGNHRVSIFDKAGSFIYFFGSSGSGSGQFNSPRGIALGPSGDIYVSDYGNKRIQVFSDY